MIPAFQPAKLMGDPHLQSLLGSLGVRRHLVARRADDFERASSDLVLQCSDGVRLHGYDTPPVDPDRCRGQIVLLHGWEGHARSTYLSSLGSRLWRKGFAVFRLHYRDHGPTHHLNEGIFHSCRIREVVDAVGLIAERNVNRPLYVAGFSLGGNFTLRVALRAPAAGIRIERAIAVNPAIDPAHVLVALERPPRLYHHYFMVKWRRSLRAKQKLFPNVYDFTEELRISDMRGLTEALISRYGDFPSIDNYFDGYSIAKDRLAALEVPSTLITAADDPIIPVSDIHELKASKALDVEIHERGGHCGFIENWALDSWIDRRIASVLGVSV